MQKRSLVPTPLNLTHSTRRPVEIVEPTLPGRFRFFSIMLFVLVSIGRSIAASVWPAWKKTRYSPLMQARRLRSYMEKMGGLWVKAGQVVALRRDLFEEEFCAELTRLQDRARGFSGKISRQIIEEDLGRPIEEIFSEFDEAPLAAASIGQTHLAKLREGGQEVVVKVQRPTVLASFTTDLRYLYWMVSFFSRLGIAPHFRWEDMYWEIEHAILEELDYGQEASSLRRMRKNLRDHKVYVPKVYLDFCSERVLVMEKVSGVYMSEFIQVMATNPERAREWLTENYIKPKRAGERLLFSHYRQLLEDNLYHCDLHPGNILLMRKNRITLIDFGSVGSTDKTELNKLLLLLTAVGQRDYRKVADVFLLMAPSLPDKDLTEFKEQVVRLYRDYEPLTRIKSLPYHEKSLGRIGGNVVRALGEQEIPVSWGLLRSNRAELTLDASLMYLLPDIDYPKTLRTYITKLRERMRKSLGRVKPLRAQLAKLSESSDMPRKLAENAYFEGEYLRKRALKYEGYLSKGAQIGSFVFMAFSRWFLLVALFAFGALIHQRYNYFQGSLHKTWLYALFEKMPQLDSMIWLLAIGGAVYVSSEMTTIRRLLEQPESVRTNSSSR